MLVNSLDNLRHPRSVAYSAEHVLLNKHQISGGGAYLDLSYAIIEFLFAIWTTIISHFFELKRAWYLQS